MWRQRFIPCPHIPAPDPVVDDAQAREAVARQQLHDAQARRPHVDERRREAAELLAVSQEAERRNHFAEAIVASMRRNQ